MLIRVLIAMGFGFVVVASTTPAEAASFGPRCQDLRRMTRPMRHTFTWTSAGIPEQKDYVDSPIQKGGGPLQRYEFPPRATVENLAELLVELRSVVDVNRPDLTNEKVDELFERLMGNPPDRIPQNQADLDEFNGEVDRLRATLRN